MSAEAFAAWRAHIVPVYAADHVAAGNWTEEESLARSEAEVDALLPDGPATAGHWLWTVRDAVSGDDVGVLWVAQRRPGQLFIYDIEMSAGRRGEGFGTAALAALEDWARTNLVSVIALHVFGHNDGARRLYARLGYVETDVQMEKRL